MTVLLLIMILTLLASLFILRKDRRNLFGGLLLGLFFIVAIFLIFFSVLYLLFRHQVINDTLAFLIIYILIPLAIVATCIGLILNTGLMHHREGKSLVAKLSILLGLNILIVLPLTVYLLSGTSLPYLLVSFLFFLCLTDLSFLFLFIAYLFYSWIYQSSSVKSPIDYIVVLGSGIRSEKVPPLLKSRLDKALNYYSSNEKRPTIVVSGGQGKDEPIAEAVAMKNYLLEQGVPSVKILLEDKSINTYQNMLFSKKVIASYDPSYDAKKIIFSTSNYHVLRAAGFAKKVHLNAEGVGAPTALYFLPTALIREFIGLLVQYKWFTLALTLIIFILTLMISF